MNNFTTPISGGYSAPSTIDGQGLFAPRNYSRGETLFRLSGRLYDGVSIHRNTHWFANTYQLDRDLYLYPETLEGRYINHSCEPNAGLREDLEMLALRDIAAGEEICFDYSTCMSEQDWTMICQCGTAQCRKIIRDFHDLPTELKHRYLRLGIVQRFIVREIFEQAALASNSRITAIENWSSLAADLLKVIGKPRPISEVVTFSTPVEESEGNSQADAPVNIFSNVA